MLLMRINKGSTKMNNRTIKLILTSFLFVFFHTNVMADHPDCSGVERWATSSAFVHLKNAGITDNESLDFTKTKTVRMASEKIGDDLYRQVHHITFTEKSGNIIKVITSNDASNEECSMTNVVVYLIAIELGN